MELRRFLRISKPYRIQYAPFPQVGAARDFTETMIVNIGAGGLLFNASEPLTVDGQLILKIHLSGWRQDGDDLVEDPDEKAVCIISALSEVLRCDYDAGLNAWAVAVRFLGRIID